MNPLDAPAVAEPVVRAGSATEVGPHRLHPPVTRGRWRADARRRRLLAAADLVAATLATLVAVTPATGTFWGLIFLPLCPVVAKLLGLYDRDHRALRHLTADEVPRILGCVGIVGVLVALLLPLTPAGTLDGAAVAVLLIASAVATVGMRAFTRWGWWRWTAPEQVGLIGNGDALESVRRKFALFQEMHLDVAEERTLEQIGTGAKREWELEALIGSVDRIVLAATGVERQLIGELKTLCRRRAVKLSVVSPLRGEALPSEPTARLADLPVLEYDTWDPSRSTLALKRIFDLMVASVGLLLLLPLLPFIALAIKLDTKGPVFFSQVRAGLDGRPFRMYKLRTMNADAEAHLEDLVDIGLLDEPAFKLQDDPRITRVGRLLRRFSIDEFPQLANVLVGEMSIVGPRPEQVELVERYSQEERFRLTVKPGITGPMQIFGRGELTFSERLAVELEYVDSPSLTKDMRIIIHTLPAVFRGTGAF